MTFSKENKELIDKLTKISNIKEQLHTIFDESEIKLKKIKEVEFAINKIIEEKTSGFPWLADAISQYYESRDLKIAEFLENKLRPAIASAQRVKELSKEKREFQKKFLIARNLLKYYESLFPWLSEYVGENIDELLIQFSNSVKEEDEEEKDPVSSYLTKSEYDKLSITERNQKALDRYWQGRKSKWQIGRDYERFNGYIYEKAGYNVYYQGIIEGFADLGRDLIVKKGESYEIIQCKYWAKEKIIHEKHINQLFGTTIEFFIKNIHKEKSISLEMFPNLLKQKNISATLITSASLSDTAKSFAEILNIKYVEHFPLEKYPSIKCNIANATKEKIYHLPFDQQYDRTIIEEEKNECYAETVKEAEALGFRRAFHWSGNINKK